MFKDELAKPETSPTNYKPSDYKDKEGDSTPKMNQ